MDPITQPHTVHFYSSANSPVARNRRWLWYCFGMLLLLVLVMSRGSFTALLLTTFLALPIVAALDWRCRRALREGLPLVTLTPESLSSPLFKGGRRSYGWQELSGWSVRPQAEGLGLSFTLAEQPRSGWRAKLRLPARVPYIPLAALAPDDRKALVSVVTKRITHPHPDGVAANVLLENEAVAFEERLKALAPLTWVTYALVAVNVGIWCLTLALGAELTQSPTNKLFAWGGNAASEAQRGEWWRMFSAMFLHSGILHVGMNMLGLLAAGVTVERIFGHRQFAIIYIGAGLLGNAFSLHYSAQQAVSVGASGAVFGVAGALLVAVYQHRETLPKVFSSRTLSSMGFFIGYSLLQGFGKQGIDNAAHIGGLLGGMALAYILPERFDLAYFQQRFKSRLLAGAALIGLSVVAVAAVAPQATVDQRQMFANAALFERGVHGLQAAMEALAKDQVEVKGGRMTELEADERSRKVFAPMFQSVNEDLAAIRLAEGDPRAGFLADATRLTALMVGILSMDSVLNTETGKYDPADAARAEAINKELAEVQARIVQWAKDAATRKK